MKPLRFMGVGLSLLLVLPAVANPALGAPEGRGSTLEQSSGGADASQDRIIKTRRQIKESLLNAALTTSEMSEVFAYLESFVQNYSAGFRKGDREVLSIGLDTYLARKVQPVLSSYGLSAEEREQVEKMLRTWIDEEVRKAPGRAGK